MTPPTTLREPHGDASPLTLEQLFETAASFGRVDVYATKEGRHPRRYRVNIEFETIPGTSLAAKSEFDMTIHDAFAQAIARANQIKAQFK